MYLGHDRTKSPKVLVLWDIDHTLMESRGVGPAVYRRAFRNATGRELERYAIVPGRTELAISAEMLRLNGLDASEGAVLALIDSLLHEFQIAKFELAATGRALPGAKETLAQLAAEPRIHQSVLTGNVRELAILKLKAFGLDVYLHLDSGAYGDDHENRANLVFIAQRRAAERLGAAFGPRNTILVGDTPYDVRAAKEAGTRVIAVATGASTVQELVEAGADLAVSNLRDRRLLQMIVLQLMRNP